MCGDCSSRRPGITASPTAPGPEPAGAVGQYPALRARGHAGNRRLYRRWQGFTERKKNPLVANVAVARELSGWCWSLATM